MGQSLGVPVWKLLGGKFRERVPAYANGWYQAEREPATIAALAKQVVARGYRALKLDPFGAASAELSSADCRRVDAIVRAVRDAVGPDVQMLIEMHGRFTPATAVRVAATPRAVQPGVDRGAGAARERRGAGARPAATRGSRSPPASAPTRSARSASSSKPALPMSCRSISRTSAAFSPIKRVAGWAEAHYLLMAPHNVCGPVGTMANVHFAIATPNYKVLEHFNDFADQWVKDLVDYAPQVAVEDGCFGLPERPGLGLKLNHEACRAHPRTGGTLKLFEAGLGKARRSALKTEPQGSQSTQRKPESQRTLRAPRLSEDLRSETPRKSRRIARRRRHGGAAAHAGTQRFVDRAAAQPDGDVAGVEGIARADRIDGVVAADLELAATPSAVRTPTVAALRTTTSRGPRECARSR